MQKTHIFLFTSVLPFSWSTRRYEAREELLLRNALSVFPHQAVPVPFKQVQDTEVVSLRGTGHLALVMLVSAVFTQLLAGSCDVFIPSRHPLRWSRASWFSLTVFSPLWSSAFWQSLQHVLSGLAAHLRFMLLATLPAAREGELAATAASTPLSVS